MFLPKNIHKNSLALLWIALFLSLLFIQNGNQIVSLFIIATYLFFIFGFDFIESVFLSLILSIPFRSLLVGSKITVVSPQVEKFLDGYSYYFGMDILSILFFLLLLLLLLSPKGHSLLKKLTIYLKNDPIKSCSYFLTGFFVFAAISSISAHRIDLALTGFISISIGIGIYFFGLIFFQNNSIKKQFFYYLTGLLLLLGIIGTSQFLLKHSLGIYIETKSSTSNIEFMTTDGLPLYRVVGIMPHPTFFASTLSLLLLCVIGIHIQLGKKEKISMITTTLAIFFGTIALFGTFSRSSWFAFFIGIIGFIIFHVKKKEIQIKGKINFGKLLRISALILVFSFLTIIILSKISSSFSNRLQSYATVWNVGNWQGRTELIKHSFLMIKENPITGVGPNHFTDTMTKQGVVQEHRGFIFPVHNTYLLFFSEIGVIAGLLFLIFTVFLLWKTWPSTKNSPINLGIWMGSVTFIINAQFHTLFNQDPSFNLFLLLAAFLLTQSTKKLKNE